MTLYAISHVTTGNPTSEAIFTSYTFYEKESRAQAVLESYKEEYQKFYEVKPFTITPQT
jgi:glutamate synthase domain-containing protein 3